MNGKKNNYFNIPHNVLDDKDFKSLSTSTKLVLVYLFKYSNRYQKDGFFRRVEDICKDIRLSKATVIKAKKELVENNFLVIHKKGNKNYKHKNCDEFFLGFNFEDKTSQIDVNFKPIFRQGVQKINRVGLIDKPYSNKELNN